MADRIGRENVVAIATDSLDFVGPVPHESLSPKLGDFKLTYERATVTNYQNGLRIIEEQGKPPKLKRRGFPSLTVERLLAGGGRTKLTVYRRRAMKLKECLRVGNWTPSMISRIRLAPSTSRLITARGTSRAS